MAFSKPLHVHELYELYIYIDGYLSCIYIYMIIYEYLVKILSFKMSEEMLRPYRYFFFTSCSFHPPAFPIPRQALQSARRRSLRGRLRHATERLWHTLQERFYDVLSVVW
jgi:hypothetical protein